MRTFEEYRAMFRPFYDAVKECHLTSERPHQGHGLDHDVTVAQIGANIAPDDQIAEMVWCAGMLHSVDRMVDYKVAGLVEKTIRDLATHLTSSFSDEEIDVIVEAAYRHGELNQDDQSLTQICLMDADRVANLQPAVVIRAGQLLANKPALEFQYLDRRNPDSTYSAPASVLDDLRNNIAEYLPKMRTASGLTLAEMYAAQLEDYIRLVRESHEDVGLIDIKL